MSFWKKLFPYRSFLEQEIERLRADNRRLLDKLLLVSTGISDEPLPEPLSVEGKATIREAVDDASEHAPYGNDYPTFAQLLQGMEARSMQKNADDMIGPEIEEGASIINAREATDEDDHQRELEIRKKSQQAVALATTEYLSNQHPIEVE